MIDTKREIKFRAWDTTNKRMILEPYIHFVDGKSFYLDQRSRGGKMRSDLEIELMQFTGLLDKNGKEIYEGDIVLVCFNDGSIYDHPQHVYFEKGSFCVGMGYLSDSKIIEVIGSIYENPELIKE